LSDFGCPIDEVGSELKKALLVKHKETFWISAESEFKKENEYFWYKSAIHTKNPLLNQFGLLIDIGAITLDYPIKRLPSGSVKDKGCNFKLKSNALNLLFPPSKLYTLTEK
jgi:MvaI/BcnI restriction endonuclease family